MEDAKNHVLQIKKWKLISFHKTWLLFFTFIITCFLLYLGLYFGKGTVNQEIGTDFLALLYNLKPSFIVFLVGYTLFHFRVVLKNWNKAKKGEYSSINEFKCSLSDLLPKYLINYPVLLSIIFCASFGIGLFLTNKFGYKFNYIVIYFCFLGGWSSDFFWNNGNILGIFQKFK